MPRRGEGASGRGGEGTRGRNLKSRRRPVAQSPRRPVAPLSPSRIPVSTYRLQLNKSFRFADVLALIPYLHQLGISDLYSSPIFKARPESRHGYDVVDPTTMNPELGTRRQFERIVRELQKLGMGLLLDIVPNHMATGAENKWWMDVLARGPRSPYAHFFDIDWHSAAGKPNLENKVLLPILERPYGEALEKGHIKLVRENGTLWVRYADHRLPVSKPTYQLVGSDLRRINSSTDELDRVLEEQFYRLAFWPLASEELNYRRFFDIGELIGICVEDERVFEATHRLVKELTQSGWVTGLRVDHVDGLHDPVRYVHRLQHIAGEEKTYVVVEKILDADERLPQEMTVEGTTGYDFLNLVNSVFVDRDGIATLRETYRRFTGIEEDFPAIVYRRKKRAVARLFAGEVNRLSRRLAAIAAGDRIARDIPLSILVNALIDITASLPVYRTYTNSPIVSDRDRAYIDTAVQNARRLTGDERRVPAYEFLRRLLILDYPPGDEATAGEWLGFVIQWQQLTGPAMAKGFEDTALYVYYPLLSLNEVGGDPEFHEETTGLEAFHRRNSEFLEKWPHSLNTTTTHDTKRSEGARARLNVLSELPDDWGRRVRRWRKLNEKKKRRLNGEPVPDPNEEILLYQTLLGSWPLERNEVTDFKKRLAGHIQKAAREAKTHSSWIQPREDYERLLQRFAAVILKDSPQNRFLRDFLEIQARVAFYAAINAIAQVALKVTSPGVPDFYQGSELWDFSMVDPDNRRPIDFHKRAAMLREVERPQVDYRALLRSWKDGRVKMFVTQRTLAFRSEFHRLFASGQYLPLLTRGVFAGNLCAFARTDGVTWSVTLVPRFCTRLVRPGRFPIGEVWSDTRIVMPASAPQTWRNVLTGETVKGSQVSTILSTFPVAILESR